MHFEATGQKYTFQGACAKRLTAVLDERVPREGDADAALAELRAAVEAFHRKAFDAFPSGWTVIGFSQDVNRWVQAAAAPPRARGSPTSNAPPRRGRLAIEEFLDDDDLPPHPANVLDAAWTPA